MLKKDNVLIQHHEKMPDELLARLLKEEKVILPDGRPNIEGKAGYFQSYFMLNEGKGEYFIYTLTKVGQSAVNVLVDNYIQTKKNPKMEQFKKEEALNLAEEALYVETGLNNADSVFISKEKIYDSLSVYEEIGNEVLIEEGIFSQEGILNPDFVKYGVGITFQFVKDKHPLSDTLIKHKVHLFSPAGAAYIEALLRLKLNLE